MTFGKQVFDEKISQAISVYVNVIETLAKAAEPFVREWSGARASGGGVEFPVISRSRAFEFVERGVRKHTQIRLMKNELKDHDHELIQVMPGHEFLHGEFIPLGDFEIRMKAERSTFWFVDLRMGSIWGDLLLWNDTPKGRIYLGVEAWGLDFPRNSCGDCDQHLWVRRHYTDTIYGGYIDNTYAGDGKLTQVCPAIVEKKEESKPPVATPEGRLPGASLDLPMEADLQKKA